MADEGTLRDFLDKHLGFKDDNVLNPTPEVSGDKNEITPEKAMSGIKQAKDPRVITDDQGRVVDYDTGDPISNAAKGIINKPAEKGTLRNFLQRMLSPERERNNAGLEGGAQPRTEELLGVPNKNVSPSTLAPTVPAQPKNYAMAGLDAPSIQELRASIYKQAGQGAPPLAAPATQDPNSLGARMSGPYSQVEQKSQMNEAQNISDMFSLRPNPAKKAQGTPFSRLFPGRQN